MPYSDFGRSPSAPEGSEFRPVAGGPFFSGLFQRFQVDHFVRRKNQGISNSVYFFAGAAEEPYSSFVAVSTSMLVLSQLVMK